MGNVSSITYILKDVANILLNMRKDIDSEKAVERKLVELVKANGGICIKLLCEYFIGLPDRMCLFPGSKIIFVELKTTGKKPRPIQILVHNKIKALGFRVEVLDTITSVINFINDIKNERRKNTGNKS